MSEYTADTSFIDLAAQQSLIKGEINTAIATVLDHGHYIMGPEVQQLEKALQDFTGAKYAITCANGTDAISLVLMAWGVGVGDAVFVPSFTYVASAEAPAVLGATPFFVDVDERTFNLNPESLQIAIDESRAAGLNPRAVVAVDLFGLPCDIHSISAIAQKEGLKVLVDGAQSFGGRLSGRTVGSMGDATTTSFFPAKPLGCYGDGGAIFTSSSEDAETIKSIRLHGKGTEKYDNVRLGVNSRLDTIQAAILLQKIKIFPAEIVRRQEIARVYEARLASVAITPSIPEHCSSAWAQYTIQVPEREYTMKALGELGIPTAIYYPKPLHKQSGYMSFPVVSGGAPVSERLANTVLSLPMHPYIRDIEQLATQIAGVLHKIGSA